MRVLVHVFKHKTAEFDQKGLRRNNQLKANENGMNG